jgi:hypothetical protein
MPAAFAGHDFFAQALLFPDTQLFGQLLLPELFQRSGAHRQMFHTVSLPHWNHLPFKACDYFFVECAITIKGAVSHNCG